jgi:hypothetical protein
MNDAALARRIAETALTYNQANSYRPDLLIARREIAARVFVTGR